MGNGKSIAAMVLGIISVVFCLTGYFSLIIGIIAIVFASLSMKNDKTGKGMAITGLVTGIIGTILGVLYAILWTALAATL